MHHGLPEGRGPGRRHPAAQAQHRTGLGQVAALAARCPVSHAYPAADYQPRWFRRRPSPFWFVERRSYLVFVLRELSSLFVAWFVAFLLLLLRAIAGGPGAY